MIKTHNHRLSDRIGSSPVVSNTILLHISKATWNPKMFTRKYAEPKW